MGVVKNGHSIENRCIWDGDFVYFKKWIIVFGKKWWFIEGKYWC